LDDSQYQTLRAAVSSPSAFGRGLARCEEIAGRLGGRITPRDVSHILASLSFLYDRLREWESSQAGTGRDALREFLAVTRLDSALGDDEGRGFRRLLELTEKNPAIERRSKLRWLRTGILDTASQFASFVDIRPRFSDDRSEVLEFVPVVILRVVVHSDFGEDRTCAFQLPSDSLAELRGV